MQTRVLATTAWPFANTRFLPTDARLGGALMSIPWKARGMRLSDEQLRWIDEVVDVMAPMLKGRTAAVGWGMGIVRTILTTPSILQAVEQAFQDASCRLFVSRVYDTKFAAGNGSGASAVKPGPAKLTTLEGGSERLVGTNSTYCAATGMAAGRRFAYSAPPFRAGKALREMVA